MGEVEDDDDNDDDDEEERKIMKWMLRRRRRKMMRWRGEDVEEEGRSQERETHFVRACAVEMHMDV